MPKRVINSNNKKDSHLLSCFLLRMTVIKARFADMPRPERARSAAALAAPPGGQCRVLLRIEELDALPEPNRRFAPIIATADPAVTK